MNGNARDLANADDAETARSLAADLLAAGDLMGLLQEDPDAWFQGDVEDDAAIDALIDEREAARAARNFARADEIREQLTEMGIQLEDGSGGTRWRRIATD